MIGFRSRGMGHIKEILRLQQQGEKVRIVALCDVDRDVLAGGLRVMEKYKQKVTPYLDLRALLENPEVDAVTIATPNHWHALATIWACQAGKDVYVEKPVCHNVWEGRKMVEAARKYRRIVQTGTQSRSRYSIRDAVAWVRAGNLGRILIARGLCYKRRRSIGRVNGPQPIPPSVDYNLWCGPAPMKPLMRARLHYDWHWFWDTGNGDLGNQGIHQMDIARWFLGEPKLSPRVMSVGGRLGYVDDGQTPNTQIVWHEYPSAPLIFEVRGLPEKKGSDRMDRFMGGSIAVVIHCEGGHVLVTNGSVEAFDAKGKRIKKFPERGENHFANFFRAVRSRRVEDLNADIYEGFISSSLCHTGNISYRLGERAPAMQILEKVRSLPDGELTFVRMLTHLKANGVNYDFDQITLGELLIMDPDLERFEGNPFADELLTRHYRKPFVVPERV